MTLTRKAALTVLMALLAILGNHLHLHLFFGLDLVFGSIPALLALSLLGIVPAVIVAAVGGVYTIFLWGHSYALLIFVAEVLVVGLLRRRLMHLVMADAVYWLFAGVPLILLFYHWTLDLNWMQTGLIALKQPINGVLNAMIVSLLMLAALFIRPPAEGEHAPGLSISSLLFKSMVALALLSGLTQVVANSHDLHREVEREMLERLNFFAGEAVKRAATSTGAPDHVLDGFLLRESMSLALVSAQGKVVAEHGMVHSLRGGGRFETSGGGLKIWLPDGKMAAVQRWRLGYYVRSVPVEGAGAVARVVVEQAAAPSVDRIERQRLHAMGLLVTLVLGAIVLAALISRWLSRPLQQLETLSRDLPKRVASGEIPAIGSSRVNEYDNLASSIRAMAEALSASFREQAMARESLEQQVQERTAALVQREAMLTESEARFRNMADNAPALIWLSDPENSRTWYNQCWLEYTGHEMAHELAHAWAEGVHPDDLARYTSYCKEVFDARGRCEIEFRLGRADGGYGWIAETGIPRFNAEGRFEGYIGYCWDIDERKTAQNELLLARDAAEAASTAKSEFLASMSHELRTPLNAILGFSQLFGMDPHLSEGTKEQAQEIERAGQHLLSLINDLIDLARIESGKLEFSLEPVPVRSVIGDSLALVGPIAGQQGIALIHGGSEGEAETIRADYVRLRQVIINLLSNAIKYNRPQGTVTLSCGSSSGKVRIGVADTGLGIPAAKQARIFNAFDRLGKEAGAVEGTGIGLVIAKRMVEAMGGVIGFESVEGHGSTFWVEFPLESATPCQAGEKSAPVASPGTVPQAPCPVVLYIEDNPMNLRLMQQILAARKGLRLRDTHTAEIGIDLIRAEPPSLILMDINLPGMDGYQALKVLKADPSVAHIPVIAVSANAMKGDEARGLAAGFAAYFTKPLDIPALLTAIDKLSGQHGSNQ